MGFVRGLPDHSLTDRLVRGRAWIPVLGVLLAGIVALQVSLLQLNASMGRAIEQGTTLQTENGELHSQVASLSAVPRIEKLAGNMGMVMATPEQMTFLSPRGGGIRGKAIADMTAPSSSAVDTAQAAATSTAQDSASTTTAPSTGTGGTAADPTSVASTPQAQAPPASSTTSSGAATGAGTDPTVGDGAQPTGGGATGTAVAGQPSSGGASSTGTGG
ncbi:MAG TPA: hypothetical protein VIJ20_07525 [Solirubrobacteraceae bacterium]